MGWIKLSTPRPRSAGSTGILFFTKFTHGVVNWGGLVSVAGEGDWAADDQGSLEGHCPAGNPLSLLALVSGQGGLNLTYAQLGTTTG